jgi:hypothetical protein
MDGSLAAVDPLRNLGFDSAGSFNAEIHAQAIHQIYE